MSGIIDPTLFGAGPITPGYIVDANGNVLVRVDLDVLGTINGQIGTVSGLTIVSVGDEVVVDLEFNLLPNNTFADGLESIAGVNWTIANTAVTNTFEILNGTGLRFNANTNNTVYDNATRTAANLSVPILSLIPNFDPLRTYVIDFYLSSVTFGVSGNRILMGFLLDTGGTDRLVGGGRRNTAGNQQTQSQVDGTVLGDAATDDAFGVRVDCRGVATFSGTYAAGFPIYPRAGGTAAVPNSFNGPFDPTQSNVVIAFPTGEAGGAMDCTIERMRIRRIAA